MTDAADGPRGAATSNQRCLRRVREMVLSGELLPGEKVLQTDLAETLNVSRIPLREALSTLQAEGLLVHKPNTGYTVARFSTADVEQIYRMRQLLETELLRSIPLDEVDVSELQRNNDRVKELMTSGDSAEIERIAMNFHFRLFDLSPLNVVHEEVERLWYRSNFPRQYFVSSTGSPKRIHADHQKMIRALKKQDVETLVRLHDEHRVATPETFGRRQGGNE